MKINVFQKKYTKKKKNKRKFIYFILKAFNNNHDLRLSMIKLILYIFLLDFFVFAPNGKPFNIKYQKEKIPL